MGNTHASLKRRLVVACSTAAVIASLGAGAVLAGETTGSGKSLKLDDPGKWGTWLHSRSMCAYSGLNDEISAEEPGRVQNWGSIPKEVRDLMGPMGFQPGNACNPNGEFSEP